MPRPRQHKALWEGGGAGCDLTPRHRRYSPLIYARLHIRLRVSVYFMWLPSVRVCEGACVTEGTLSNGERSLLWSEGVLIPINSVPNAHRETHFNSDAQTRKSLLGTFWTR